MELCRHCGIRPPHRTNSRTCSVCKYKRSSKAKERAANPKRKKKIVEPRLEGFYIDTPHQISRSNIKDKFNGWY